jgi:alpha-1,6-mannosyltransferase
MSSSSSSSTATTTTTTATLKKKKQSNSDEPSIWLHVFDTMRPKMDILDLVMIIQSIAYILMAPYTKVEESFNTQATHDLLYFPTNLEAYDHFMFPGVVPRTFLGSVIISTMNMPIVYLLKRCLSEPQAKFLSLCLVRFTLGLFSILAQCFFRNGITLRFGASVSKWYAITVICQFHLLFYFSRPLPNTFALIFIFMALGYWMRDQHQHLFVMLAITAVIFRSDTFVFIVPIAIISLLTGKIGFFTGIILGFLSIIIGIVYSIVVDSYFWQRIVWSEGEVLYYNTVLNKSHEWGVQPAHWYFSSALPRALLGTAAFIPFGIVFHRHRNTSVLPYFLSGLLFVAFYSLLPHKELRFIFFGIPLFNLTAAVGIERIRSKFKSIFKLLSMGLILSFVASLVFLYISSYNYYGAGALNRLHRMESKNYGLKYVHMDAHVTMNGVSRYLQYPTSFWIYSKQEKNVNYRDYTHILSGKNLEQMNLTASYFPKVFALVGTENGFDGLGPYYLPILSKPKIFIYKRKVYIETLTEQERQEELERIKKCSYSKEEEDEVLMAPLKWTQRPDRLIFTIEIPNIKQQDIYITRGQRFLFKGITESGKKYSLDFTMLGLVDYEDYYVTPGNSFTKITIMKAWKGDWPRLLKNETEKPAYIQYDWNNWVESEDNLKSEESRETLKQLRDGHGTTQTKFLALVFRNPQTLDSVVDNITYFMEIFSQGICPPFLFAFLVTFFSVIMFTLFHLTSAVDFILRQQNELQRRNKVKRD